MRLIDADKLLDYMKRNCKGNCKQCADYTILSSDHHCGAVDLQPTAYDLEAVVKELEKNKRGFFILDGVTVRTIPLDKAIEIVRGGRNEG